MGKVRLSPGAQSDIDNIWSYSLSTWGAHQAEAYLRQLQTAIAIIADNPLYDKSCDELRAGYRKFAAASHLFYKTTANGINIMRILHQRMDVDHNL